MTTDVTTPAVIKPPEPRDIAQELCEAEIAREVGVLSLHQRIAICRALDRFADAVAAYTHDNCPW